MREGAEGRGRLGPGKAPTPQPSRFAAARASGASLSRSRSQPALAPKITFWEPVTWATAWCPVVIPDGSHLDKGGVAELRVSETPSQTQWPGLARPLPVELRGRGPTQAVCGPSASR